MIIIVIIKTINNKNDNNSNNKNDNNSNNK